jgi:cyclophilin family peptidyl-prolyl cis-trans isomerase
MHSRLTSELLRKALSRTLSAATVGIATIAAAQQAAPPAPAPKITPQAVPVAPPPAPLPPPLSRTEQRFRDLAAYVKSKGAIDATTRGDIVKLAADIDVELDAPTSDRTLLLRLLPARAQISIWLADEQAMDKSFERLLSMTTAPDAVAIAWGRELNADGRFEKALEFLQPRTFQGEPAQASYNTAPALGRSTDQLNAIANGTRKVSFSRYLFNRELSAIQRDQQRGDLPMVELTTSKGPVLIELFEEQAPNTVGNFIERIEAGAYDGTTFHRFMRGFGIQGGDPATASGGVGGKSNGGWVIPDECERADRRAPFAGRLVMAKQQAGDSAVKPGSNTAGAQFTILLSNAESLDGFYTVFGRVLDGMEAVRKLREDDQIVRASVLSKRNHSYAGVRLGEGRPGDYTMPRPGIPLTPAQTGEAQASQ